MPAAEDERARAIEAVEQPGLAREPDQGRQQQEAGEERQRAHGDRTRDGDAEAAALAVPRRRTAQHEAERPAEQDRPDLGEDRCRQNGRAAQDRRHPQGGDGAAREIGRERARHPDQGLRDDAGSRRLQPADPAAAQRLPEQADAERGRRHQQSRRQGEAEPRDQHARNAAPRQADRHAHLTRGGTGQELGQGHEVRIAPVVEPAAPLDEGVTEVPEVSDRPAEGGAAQRQEDPEQREQPLGRRAGRARACAAAASLRRVLSRRVLCHARPLTGLVLHGYDRNPASAGRPRRTGGSAPLAV